MERFNLLRHVAGILESMGLRYFVTGSSATIVYGEPRMTNDIDIVVDLPEHRVAALCKHFLNDHYYISEEAAHEAVRRKSQHKKLPVLMESIGWTSAAPKPSGTCGSKNSPAS